MPKDGKKLSDRHRQLLNYYYGVSNLDKTDALRRAGFACPNQSHATFNIPSVRAEMRRREREFARRYEITHDRIATEMAKLAFFNPMCVLEIDEETGLAEVDLTKPDAHEMAAISEIRVEEYWEGKGDDRRKVTRVRVKPWNKLAALEGLMRHAGLSKDKVQVEGTVNLVDRLREARRRVAPADEEAEEQN